MALLFFVGSIITFSLIFVMGRCVILHERYNKFTNETAIGLGLLEKEDESIANCEEQPVEDNIKL